MAYTVCSAGSCTVSSLSSYKEVIMAHVVIVVVIALVTYALWTA